MMRLTVEEIRNELFCGKRITDIPLRVTFYGRVSTDEERQLDSLAHQAAYFENSIRDAPHWTYVPGYVDEGVTGTRADKRPQFCKMVRDAKAGLFDLILTKEVSRFARDVIDCVQTTRELLRYGVGVLIEDIQLNTMERDAEFRLSIMAIVAQEESRKTSERVKFGYRQTMKEGKRHGAKPPLGYLFNNENNGYLVDERKAPIVRYVFSEYARGVLGTRRIACELEKRGWLNDSGKPYHPSTIERMIRNPVYKGFIVNGKSYKPSYREDRKIMRPEAQWQLHYDPVRVPPLIDDGVWAQANRVLRGRSARMLGVDCKSHDSTGNGRYAYSGRIVCGTHNCMYHRYTARWTVDGTEKRVEAWRCSLYKDYGRKRCDGPLLYKRDLDKIMRQLFAALIPLLNDACAPVLEAIEQTLTSNPQHQTDDLKEQKADLEGKKKRLLDGWMDGLITDGDYRKAGQRIDAEIAEVNARLAELHPIHTHAEHAAKLQAIRRQTVQNANLESEEMIDALVRCFVQRIIVQQKEQGERKEEREEPYELIFWLYNGNAPIPYDLALLPRTHPFGAAKGVFLTEMEYLIPKSKIQTSWSRRLTVKLYLECA